MFSCKFAGIKFWIATSVNSFSKSSSLAKINNFLATSFPPKSSRGSGSVYPLLMASCNTFEKGTFALEKLLNK